MKRRIAVLVAIVVTPIAAGCDAATSGDKAGASRAPVVLRMAVQVNADAQPDAALIQYFARAVHDVSNGKVRVNVVFDAAGDATATPEQDVARMVKSGRFDLGLIGSRAWDELGVDALRALQAPFLIDNVPLMETVAEDPLAARLLADLRPAGVVGLALVPIELRHPFGRRPFVSVSDFTGAHARAIPSRTSDALFAALGAVPVHPRFSEAFTQIADGRIDVAEAGGGTQRNLNTFSLVVLFPKLDTLFANPHALTRVSQSARAALREAAARTNKHIVATSHSAEADLVDAWCRNPDGRVVAPTPAQMAGLERAAAPVTAQLERDPETRSLIAAIERLKAMAPPGPRVVVPAACSAPSRAIPLGSPAAGRPSHVSSRLDGTYRFVLTKADARAHGTPADRSATGLAQYPMIGTWMLRGGAWANSGGDSGTYTIHGDRLVFNWRTVGSILHFSFNRDGDGTLHLTPVGEIDSGDRFVWTTEPWRRVGPASAGALEPRQP